MKKIKFIDPPGGWKYGFPTNSKINMRLGLCNYPINIYYCKKCFNARL